MAGSGRSLSIARAISREPCTFSPSSFMAGTVLRGNPSPRSTTFEITGIRSRRLWGIPLCSSISAIEMLGCEAGITYSRASTARYYAPAWHSGNNRRVLLAVDVGNTQTHLGAFDGERLAEHWRFQTRSGATGDELAERIAG